ncbi:hypothetical protein CHUAL_013269 [Chamberlinius hualienensis]
MVVFHKFRRLRTVCFIILFGLFTISCVLHIYMISHTVYCLKWKTEDVIKRLCNDYNRGEIAGQLCETLCHRSTRMQARSCFAPHLAKDVVFTSTIGHKTVVIKSEFRDAHDYDELPSHIDAKQTFNNSVTELAMVIQSLLSVHLSEEEYAKNYVYESLKSILLVDFGISSLKQVEKKDAILKSLWFLVQQKEYLTFKFMNDSELFPEVVGSCGHLYAVEYFTPLTMFLKSSWKIRAEITFEMLNWLETAQFYYKQPVHFCDIKFNHFGVAETKGVARTIKFLDADDIFFQSTLSHLLNHWSNCTSNEHCKYFDCQMTCNTETGFCDDSTLNNNLQVVCSKLFSEQSSATSAAFKPHFLYSLPISSETKALQELFYKCSSSNSRLSTGRGKTCRSKSSNGIRPKGKKGLIKRRIQKVEIKKSWKSRVNLRCNDELMSGKYQSLHDMPNFETNYESLPSQDNGDDNHPEGGNVLIHVVPESSKTQWNHVDDLDSFFTRISFNNFNILLQDFVDILIFGFVVFFAVFVTSCVDYPVLFHDKLLPSRNSSITNDWKVTLADSFIPLDQCVKNFNPLIIICMFVASVVMVLCIIRMMCNAFHYYEIRSFYYTALKITDNELDNMTWHQVQQRVQEVQREQQMCIHKPELTELDIYHRILRNKNYMVAMVNKNLLPLAYRVPFIGDMYYLTKGLRYNLEIILFWGPGAPFENGRLKEEYKKYNNRTELANQLSNRILWIGFINFILTPFMFLWEILSSVFYFVEVLRREPTYFAIRRWSLYSRLYLRHFNELDHELNARLSRAHHTSTKYMNSFSSPNLAIIAKSIQCIAGSILGVLVILTLIDEDVLHVEHVLLLMTALGVTLAICRAFIPDENLVFCPEDMLRRTLGQIHYMPDHWIGNAHTSRVRNEFSQLFPYTASYILHEMLSPLLTPLILIFHLRRKHLDVVDFFRNFTVEVVGVGDVCSFAQMDIKKHGHPQWVADNMTESNQINQAENGKTELSLVHFAFTNPGWKPPGESNAFITQLKEQRNRVAENLNSPFYHEATLQSSSSLEAGYPAYVGCMFNPMQIPDSQVRDSLRYSYTSTSDRAPSTLVGAVNQTEGPLQFGGTGMFRSNLMNSMLMTDRSRCQSFYPSREFMPSESISYEMSCSALYMHDLHRMSSQIHNYADTQPRTTTWLRHEMPNIQESIHEEEVRSESLPLLENRPSDCL